ncbi:DedA family protein [Pleionea sp. CnH1-48]|uniref:DedA family protein n=1 Tax=Pleionea sp. CnH1-48 TaxID=2954494 RepID=UPI002096D74F|nr:DedA family protein [Pleionea sp. CnH1-48]MCO7227365.1 DedA family protein [Pleionea sp. CnH1-48]
MLQTWANNLLGWIEANPEMAFIVTATVAFLESMAVVGVLVPGWLILVGIGSLVGTLVLPFDTVVIAMFTGAVIGEGVSYCLGYYWRDSIRHWKWFQRHQSVLSRADRLVETYGIMGLFIGRFIGPVRALLPVVVGVSGMRPATFWSINVISGLLWAPLYLLPGIFVGAALVLPEGSRESLLIIVGAVIGFTWMAIRQYRKYRAQSSQNESGRTALTYSMLYMMIALMCLIVFFSSSIATEVFDVLKQVWELVIKDTP